MTESNTGFEVGDIVASAIGESVNASTQSAGARRITDQTIAGGGRKSTLDSSVQQRSKDGGNQK
jgi:hypothetical protein